MIKKILFITLIFTSNSIIKSQTKNYTLRQLIDSAINNIQNITFNTIDDNVKYPYNKKNQSNTLEISFKDGYLYSNNKEYEIFARYDFFNPWELYANKNVDKAYSKYYASVVELNKKKVIMNVKQEYYKCIFEKIKYYNLKHIVEFFQDYIITDSINNKDLSSLELMNIYYEKLAELDDAYNDYLLAISKLSRTASLNTIAEPADTILELYEIITKSDTTTRTPARLFENVYNNEISLTIAQLNQNKANYYPHFFAGYGVRNGYFDNTLMYWQVGLSIPLDFLVSHKRNNLSDIKIEEKKNIIYNHQKNIKGHVDELLILMNKCFDRLNNFYNYIIPNTNSIENAFLTKLSSNESIHIDDIKLFIKARNSVNEYYKTILDYNLLAIELEVYTY